MQGVTLFVLCEMHLNVEDRNPVMRIDKIMLSHQTESMQDVGCDCGALHHLWVIQMLLQPSIILIALARPEE